MQFQLAAFLVVVHCGQEPTGYATLPFWGLRRALTRLYFFGILVVMSKETKRELLLLFATILGVGGIAFAILFVFSNDALGFMLSITAAAIGGVCGVFSTDDVE